MELFRNRFLVEADVGKQRKGYQQCKEDKQQRSVTGHLYGKQFLSDALD